MSSRRGSARRRAAHPIACTNSRPVLASPPLVEGTTASAKKLRCSVQYPSSRAPAGSRQRQLHANHRQPIAVHVARIPHRNPGDLAVIDRAAERLAAGGEIAKLRRQSGVDRIERGVDRDRAGGQRVARVEVEEQLGFDRALRGRQRSPLIGFRVPLRAGTGRAAWRPARRSTVSADAKPCPRHRRSTARRTRRRMRLRGS